MANCYTEFGLHKRPTAHRWQELFLAQRRKALPRIRRFSSRLCTFAPLRQNMSPPPSVLVLFVQGPRFGGSEGFRLFMADLVQREAANGVFADAAEVQGAVALDDVCDLGVAVGGAVLEVLDYAAFRV